MTPNLRADGSPTPFDKGTHYDGDLPPPIPFDAAQAGARVLPPASPAEETYLADPFDVGTGAPPWLVAGARLIRPICVGALMAIPTIGAAAVGLVAAVDRTTAMNMTEVSIAFLAGIPTEIVILIGTLATGYGFAKSIERLKGPK